MRHAIVLAFLPAVLLTGCASRSVFEPSAPTLVTVSPDIAQFLQYADTQTLKVAATNAAGQSVRGDIVWGSSNPKVVSVSQRGVLTAVSCGTATISATVQNVTGVATAYVLTPLTGPWAVEYAPQLGVNMAAMSRQPGGVYVQDLVVGNGSPIARGTVVTTHWNAWLPDGTIARGDRGKLTANDGEGGDVLTHALVGMRVGGKRRAVGDSQLTRALSFGVSACQTPMVVEIEVQA